MKLGELATPALLVDAAALDHNLRTMSAALPGARLRPHVKAHKCTSLAIRQAAAGHRTFTCATPREVVGMAKAGLGEDLLLANEVLDPVRLRAMADLADLGARVTVAVDSATANSTPRQVHNRPKRMEPARRARLVPVVRSAMPLARCSVGRMAPANAINTPSVAA